MNAPGTQLEEAERPRGAALKFTYASGSRPLEGYTIKRGVGRGGFGEVYFATSDAGKEVAIKLIRRNLEVELRGVTQCLNLKHPNLIALYDIRTDEMGDQWVIMEYVAGESLEDVIDRNPNGMPVGEALWWMRGMCAGVAYLHDHGIVHRDLKPGNIFTDEGTVKIGDYGLAKFISCSRRSGQTESVGTVHYMAPEIANGRYGREIDTYALGIILFEMLTGRVPFEGESVGEVLMKHLTAEPDCSMLEEPYCSIVRRALAKDPNVRINSVNEMVALMPGSIEDVPLTPVFAPQGQPNSRADAAEAVAPLFEDPSERRRRDINPRANRTEAAATVEEPVWKAVRGGADYVRRRWHGEGVPQMTILHKSLLVLGGILLFIWFGSTNASLVEVFIQCLIVYGIYYIVWSKFIKPSPDPRPSGSPPINRAAATNGAERRYDHHTAAWPTPAEARQAAATAPSPGKRRALRPSWRDRAQRELAAKPMRDKVTELVGSMLLAAVFAAVSASVAPLMMNQQPASDGLAMYLWLATVGTLGSWAVMVPAKLAEGKLEDQVPMRLTLLLCGALLGAIAWYLASALLLSTPHLGNDLMIDRGLVSNEILSWQKTNNNMNISPAYYIAYFAFLFLLPRWWRQTEWTRSGRVSFWWIIASVGWAWLVHVFWWFPQPAGMMAAGVIALSTQLSSPWMPPSRRRSLAAEIEGGAV
jgi:hypothetical protein